MIGAAKRLRAAEGTIDEYIRAETVRTLFEQSRIAPIVTLLLSGLVGVALWREVSHDRLLGWLGAIALLTVVRVALVLAHWRAPKSLPLLIWERAFVYTLIAMCLAWGLGAVFVMPDSLAHQALLFFVLVGIGGGVIANNSADPFTCSLCLTGLVLPTTVLAATENGIEPRVMAACGVMYLAGSIRSIRNSGDAWRAAVGLSWQLQHAKTLAERLARIDVLTGLNNRRAFTELGATALEQARRYKRPLSLVMFDIDHFKKVNDTYGHAAGDKVLQATAGAVLRAVRTPDVPGRIGGEEFVVLLPETGEADARGFAERLRVDFSKLEVAHDGATIRITSSFGVATRQDDAANLDALLKRADGALYRAKGEGRNRVVVSSNEPA